MANLAGNSSYEWHFPVSSEQVFNALVEAVSNNFYILNADDFTFTVLFETDVSALTWGQRGSAQVIRDGEGSKLRVTVSSRLSNNTFAASKVEKNMQLLLKEVSSSLKANTNPNELSRHHGSTEDAISQIRKLKDLVELKIISEDEFETKKKELLDRI